MFIFVTKWKKAEQIEILKREKNNSEIKIKGEKKVKFSVVVKIDGK